MHKIKIAMLRGHPRRPTGPELLLAALLSMGAAVVSAQVNLPVLGDAVSGTISTQQEYEFGRELLRSIRREAKALDDPLMEEYISTLTYKLAAQSELTDHRLDFILIDSEALNAFAAPGGIIGVNAGLFLYAESEGQFASVIAHELAHLSQRHYARSVQEAQSSALPNLAAMLASLVIAATVGGDAGQAALMTSQAVSVENQLRFSRSNEEEADRVGIRTLYKAGFDPHEMAGMFEQMLRMNSASRRPPEFLSTHPLDENRVADSKNRANTLPPVEYIQNVEYLLMRQRAIMHYTDNHEAVMAALQRDLPQLNGVEADAARYGIALAQLKSGRFLQAIESLDALLRKEPRRIAYVMLEAEIASAAGRLEQALAILRENLRINPGNHPLTMAYAQVLTVMGRYQEAAEILESHAVIVQDDMSLWHDLAEVQGQAGNINKVHQARGEYFVAIGDFARAKDQFSFALELEQDRLAIARIRQRLEDIRLLENRFYR